MLFFSLGYSESERLEVTVRDDISAIEVDDWLEVRVVLKVQGIDADIPMTTIPAEALRFKEELSRVYREIRGSAQFRTMEDQLSIDVAIDMLGHVAATGVLRSDLSGENRIHFTLKYDQTLLWHTISEIDEFLCATEKKEANKAVDPTPGTAPRDAGGSSEG